MRAKMKVVSVSVDDQFTGCEVLNFSCVCGSEPYGPNGESENNSFARWTPSGSCTLTVTNPNLLGKFKTGQEFYLDFTPAPVPESASV